MKRILLSLSLLTLLYHTLFAQSYNTQQAYIVTYDNDTITGLIKEQNDLSQKIIFKPDHSGDFRTYTPDDITMFSYKGAYYYKALQVSGQDKQKQKLFLLSLIEGPLNLYKGQDYFYVAKGQVDVTKLEQRDAIVKSYKNRSYKGNNYKREDKRYIRVLNYLTSDCPSLLGKVEKVKLTAHDLIEFITAYNHCIDPEAETKVNEDAIKLKMLTGLRIGPTIDKIRYIREGDYKRTYDYRTEAGYTLGVLFNLSYNDKISFQPELLVTKKGGTYQETFINNYNEDANFSLTYLQLPFSLYYTWPTQGVRPFILAGGVIGYTLSNTSYLNESGRKIDVALDKDEYGYRIGAGLSFMFKNNHHISLEYIRENSLTNGIYSFRQIEFITHSITMGIYF